MPDTDTPIKKPVRRRVTTKETLAIPTTPSNVPSRFSRIKERVAGFFGTRKTQEGSNFFISLVLLVAVVVMVNVVVAKRSIRVDVTKNQLYSLSPATKQVFARLQNKRVKATAFFERNKMVDESEDVLKEFTKAYDYFQYEFVDPIENPVIVDTLGVDRNDLMQNPIVLEWEGKKEIVKPITEENIANALVSMTSSKKQTVAFLGGHGTYSLGSNYSTVKTLLETANYSPYEEILIQKKAFTNGSPDVLVVPGNKNGLDAGERAVLEEYLNNNGHALFLVDPGDAPVFGEILQKWGVQTTNTIIFDRQGFSKDLQYAALEANATHLMGKNLTGSLVLFPQIQEILPATPVPDTLLVTTVASSTGSSAFGPLSFGIAVSNIPADGVITDATEKKQGPLSGIVAVEKKGTDGKADPKGSRIVVIGDKDFLVNNLVSNAQVRNVDLLKNTIAWLSGNEDLISVEQKAKQNEPINLTQSQHNYVIFLTNFGLPFVVIIIGVFVSIRRKRKQI